MALQPNAERHLRPRVRLGSLYPGELLANTLLVAARCQFSLESIRYQYPMETVPPGMTPAQALRKFTIEGAAQALSGRRSLEGAQATGARTAVDRRLPVRDVLPDRARHRAVCAGAEDPVPGPRFGRQFGRLLLPARDRSGPDAGPTCCSSASSARQRKEPPDIDVDFEHERREEVIQYIYAKYGRDRAAIAAVVASYRSRSAIRDVGKALGVPHALVDSFAKEHYWFDEAGLQVQSLCRKAAETGVDDRFAADAPMAGADRRHCGDFPGT